MEKEFLLIFYGLLKSKTVFLLKNFTYGRSYLRFVTVGDRSITQRKPMYDLAVS